MRRRLAVSFGTTRLGTGSCRRSLDLSNRQTPRVQIGIEYPQLYGVGLGGLDPAQFHAAQEIAEQQRLHAIAQHRPALSTKRR